MLLPQLLNSSSLTFTQSYSIESSSISLFMPRQPRNFIHTFLTERHPTHVWSRDSWDLWDIDFRWRRQHEIELETICVIFTRYHHIFNFDSVTFYFLSFHSSCQLDRLISKFFFGSQNKTNIHRKKKIPTTLRTFLKNVQEGKLLCSTLSGNIFIISFSSRCRYVDQ